MIRKNASFGSVPAFFRGAYVNDVQIFADSFKTAEGSLIFTLLPEYLETLPAGTHTIKLSFNETDMITDFSVEEPSEEPAEITYTITKGNDGSWTKASKKDYSFTLKRSELDEQAADHFKEVLIDGKKAKASFNAADNTVTIPYSVLQKLNVGKHTVTIVFFDGKAETSLTVKAAGKSTPDTSDSSKTGLWTGLTAGAILLAVLAFMLKRKADLKQ